MDMNCDESFELCSLHFSQVSCGLLNQSVQQLQECLQKRSEDGMVATGKKAEAMLGRNQPAITLGTDPLPMFQMSD